jgi:hypothetical protein
MYSSNQQGVGSGRQGAGVLGGWLVPLKMAVARSALHNT